MGSRAAAERRRRRRARSIGQQPSVGRVGRVGARAVWIQIRPPALCPLKHTRTHTCTQVLALSRMATSSNLIQEIVRTSPATPIGLIALTPSELTSSVKLVDESMRLNVNKRVLWETVQARAALAPHATTAHTPRATHCAARAMTRRAAPRAP